MTEAERLRAQVRRAYALARDRAHAADLFEKAEASNVRARPEFA
jgi:hypothetical protein